MSYLSFPSPLGMLTAFEGDGRLVAIEWGSPPPGAESTPLLAETKAQITAYFEGTLRKFDLPLAVSGTAFQQRVYAQMALIPYGQTLTYADIAERIGSASRPVGTACGRNPLPIIVPCHRVVGRNGLGGYSGGDGIDSKKFLLSLEGAV